MQGFEGTMNPVTKVEIAKELTLKVLETRCAEITRDVRNDGEAVGKVVATLFNTIYQNIQA